MAGEFTPPARCAGSGGLGRLFRPLQFDVDDVVGWCAGEGSSGGTGRGCSRAGCSPGGIGGDFMMTISTVGLGHFGTLLGDRCRGGPMAAGGGRVVVEIVFNKRRRGRRIATSPQTALGKINGIQPDPQIRNQQAAGSTPGGWLHSISIPSIDCGQFPCATGELPTHLAYRKKRTCGAMYPSGRTEHAPKDAW